MRILRHASSKTEAQEQIDDHKRLEHEGSAKLRLKDMLDKVAQPIPKYASLPFRDTSHCVPCLCLGRGQMAAFSVPLEKTPIPTDLLRELRGLSDGTLEAEYFVWSSPLLQLQQKLLDYHSAGHVHWVFAEQLNKLTGAREFAGMTTIPVTLDDLIATWERLIADIGARLDANAQRFLTTLHDGEPDFEAIGLPQAAELPAVRWKLLNLKKLSAENPDQHKAHREELDKLFT
jgi:hypothetical protein